MGIHTMNSSNANSSASKHQGQTGPKSIAGKRKSSMNALKSGLFAKTIVLPFEDERAYARHRKSDFCEFATGRCVAKQSCAASYR